MSEYFQDGVEVDAVFAISDKMAAATIVALHEKGVRVPEDVAVMGFDNTDITYIFNPTISTVSQPHKEMGKTAFKMLLDRIDGKKSSNCILQHELIIRKSTK